MDREDGAWGPNQLGPKYAIRGSLGVPKLFPGHLGCSNKFLRPILAPHGSQKSLKMGHSGSKQGQK